MTKHNLQLQHQIKTNNAQFETQFSTQLLEFPGLIIHG